MFSAYTSWLSVDFISMPVAVHSLERLGGQCWQITEVAERISRSCRSPEDTSRGARSKDGNYPSTRGKHKYIREDIQLCECVRACTWDKQATTYERNYIDKTKTTKKECGPQSCLSCNCAKPCTTRSCYLVLINGRNNEGC